MKGPFINVWAELKTNKDSETPRSEQQWKGQGGGIQVMESSEN